MKQFMFFLILMIFGFVGFTQSSFTQATFKNMLDDYKKDSKAFFVNRLSEDFRYSNPQGKFLYKRDLSRSDAQKILSTLQAFERMMENLVGNEVIEPVVFQSGNLGIVSGVHKTTLVGNEGKEITGEVACTYTFQKRKGQWLFVASQHTSLAE